LVPIIIIPAIIIIAIRGKKEEKKEKIK